MQYIIQRKWYNPLRYILGAKTLTNNVKRALEEWELDATDIEFFPSNEEDHTKALLMKKWLKKNPQVMQNVTKYIKENYITNEDNLKWVWMI